MKTILDEAAELTSGDRRKSYGHPRDNFKRTALAWSAILDIQVTAEQVGLCMSALKLVRHAQIPKRDNLVDAAGYVRTIEMLEEPL